MFPETKSIELKPCRHCGRQIEHRCYPCGTWEGPRAYARRIYCSPQCAQQGSRTEPGTRKSIRKRIPADSRQEGGPYIPGTVNRFGGDSHNQFGSILATRSPTAPYGTITVRLNNFRRLLSSNPCPA